MTREFLKKAISKLRGRPSLPRERRRLSDLLTTEFDLTVQYGPLKGYRIPFSSHWGGLARPAMLLGLYEKEVVETFLHLSKSRSAFIDIGAADGYFAVGVIFAGIFEKSYAFEINRNGRKVILESAKLNGVEQKVEVNGLFDASIFDEKLEKIIPDSVVLVDIEGAEFSLLNDEMISKLLGAALVIELHDFLFDNGEELLEDLVDRLKNFFQVSFIESGPREIPRSAFLDSLSDNERWLLCSEGRQRRMRWLLAIPS